MSESSAKKWLHIPILCARNLSVRVTQQWRFRHVCLPQSDRSSKSARLAILIIQGMVLGLVAASLQGCVITGLN